MGELKFFVVIGLIAVGGYFAFFHIDWSKKKGGIDFHERDRPTVIFVPEGTPGAKSWEDIQREQRYRATGR